MILIVYAMFAVLPIQSTNTCLSIKVNELKVINDIYKVILMKNSLSPIHTADADATKLFCRVASASAVCT